jgi:hypothetical protein
MSIVRQRNHGTPALYGNSSIESWRFAIAAFLVVRLFYALWSRLVFTIQPIPVQNLEFSGQPIMTVFSLQDNEGYVYLRQVNGQILRFQPAGLRHLVDEQTGSTWDISTGIAEQGPYSGSRLVTAITGRHDIFPYFGATHYRGSWLSMWQRFDANWYVSLAEHGYGSVPGNDHFPPLFPLLIRIFKPIFGDAFLAGLFVSHATLLLALKLLYELFTEWRENKIGRRALVLFVIYPTFFFFFSAYSESLFLATVLLAMQAMHRQGWAWAGFWIFCAILTRLQGAALIAPMLYWGWKDRSLLRIPAYWIGLVIAGLSGLFYLYLRSTLVTGDAVPLVESVWRARLVLPWETYWYAVQTIFTGKASFIDVLNWAVMTLFLILLVWGWKKIPLEYNLYTAFSIALILTRIVEGQPLISMSRYSLTLFPSFCALSIAAENPWVRRLMIYSSILLNFYLSGQFFIWGWVA